MDAIIEVPVREMTSEMIQNAYNKLEPLERMWLDKQADTLEAGVKLRHTGNNSLMFGRTQALELLAKLGIWMVEHPKAGTPWQPQR